jgi:hypothetical protein
MERFEAGLRQLVKEVVQRVIDVEFARAEVTEERTPRKRLGRPSLNNRSALPVANAKAGSVPERSSSTPQLAQSSKEWTRQTVVVELGRWLVASKDMNMSFLRRNGPRGLVDAAKRFFGRFDAALNAANLAIAPQMEGKRGFRSRGRHCPRCASWLGFNEIDERRFDRRRVAMSAAPDSASPRVWRRVHAV